MTFDEWIKAHPVEGDIFTVEMWRECWEAGAAAEREQCARECEDADDRYDHPGGAHFAELIRAKAKKT